MTYIELYRAAYTVVCFFSSCVTCVASLSLKCPFLIARSVFSKVYIEQLKTVVVDKADLLLKPYALFVFLQNR